MPTTTDGQNPYEQPTRRSRGSAAAPVLAAVAVVAVVASAVTVRTWAGDDRGAGGESGPTTSPTTGAGAGTDPPGRIGSEDDVVPPTDLPVAVALDLYVGGERVPGRWYEAEGRGTHWVALRSDRTWWWGYDSQPHRIEGEVDQPPAMSPGGGYVAHVVTGPDDTWTLVGADTERGGEGFGSTDLPPGEVSPPPRAVAVTDAGLVVAGGSRFQWLWRPLVDGSTIDLAETAPGQVVLDSTDAGLIVNEGTYGRTDASLGAPYLASLSEDGTLTRLDPVPLHGALEATEQWVAYVPPGVIGAEASGTTELQVERRDGSAAGVLTAPAGWLFVAPGFRWESADQLLALLVTRDGQTEGLARCRPDARSCELVFRAG
jgi:hypothetical protein